MRRGPVTYIKIGNHLEPYLVGLLEELHLDERLKEGL
jgi:hypothetical protein